MIRRTSPHGPLLVDTLRDVLSGHAISRLESLDVRRDLRQTCSHEELRAALASRCLPIFEQVLEFERRCGGAFWPLDTFGTLDRLGTCAALRELESPSRLLPPDLSIDFDGEILLPISADHGACYLWMSSSGTIFLCDDCEDPTAASYMTLLEREALKWGYPEHLGIELLWSQMPTMTDEDFLRYERMARAADDDEPPRPYEQDPECIYDKRLAEAIGLPVFEPATDQWRRVWFDGSRLLFPYWPWRGESRFFRAPDMDEMVRTVQAAQAVRPTVVATWRGPRGEAPKPGEPVAARIQSYELGRDVYGEILFVGTSGDLRAHVLEYDNPIWTGRLWHDREKAWEARKHLQ